MRGCMSIKVVVRHLQWLPHIAVCAAVVLGGAPPRDPARA